MTSRSDIGHAMLLFLVGVVLLLVVVTTASGQTATVTTTADLPAGTSYVAVRAFNAAGLHSGYSNVVQVTCEGAPCTRTFAWDANSESDLAGYVLVWGFASGVYTASKTVPAVVLPGTLPRPSLRIRRAE